MIKEMFKEAGWLSIMWLNVSLKTRGILEVASLLVRR
jgi:hypothetical protein